MSIKFSKESRIFRDFRCIPYADYHYLVRFYEQYFADIDHLSLDESMIITYYYAVLGAQVSAGIDENKILSYSIYLQQSTASYA